MLFAIIQLVTGFVLLVWAADRLVAGASGLASNYGISPLIIGLTIIGFGTSAPEMVVSAVASYNGNPGLAFGNALGSNITNIGLILGITTLLYRLKVDSGTLRREAPVLMLIMSIVTYLMWDLQLNKSDGVFLLTGMLMMIAWMIWLGLRSNSDDALLKELEAEIPIDMPTRRALIWTAAGLIVLPLSSNILVSGAISIATYMQVSDTIIGLTILALGTSLPELAACLAAAMKRQDELAIGNVLGSNMFNLLGVLGIAAVIEPLHIDPIFLRRDTSVMFIMTIALFALAIRPHGITRVNRLGGMALLGGYLIYLWLLINAALQGHN